MAKKQAVVVIHGMGEQVPMGTLRALVKSVWEKDDKLQRPKHRSNAGVAAASMGSQHQSDKAAATNNQYWIKPDDRAGLQELRRVTTGPLEGETNEANWPLDEGGRRTDFYEFYWADLMQGTTWQHVGSWIKGLLLRSPRQVPTDVFVIWLVLWAIAIFAAVVAALKALGLEASTVIADSCTNDSALRTAAACGDLAYVYNWLLYIWGGLVWVLLAVGVLVAAWLFTSRVVSALASSFLTLITFVLAGLTFYLISPLLETLYDSGALELVVAVGAGYLLNTFLRNYFGDVARYVQATPANVERRKLIRDRGIALFKGLHESGEYDRIVVVSHSLGTIVAYDLVNILWSQIGPHSKNRSAEFSRPALKEMDEWLAKVSRKEIDFVPQTFRDMQRAVCRSMADLAYEPATEDKKEQYPWLISDFITLGSPLTHAEFLLARDESGLDQLIKERVLPVCPPVLEVSTDPETGKERRSFMYQRFDTGESFAHHASCFAAVRWTNIYDKPPNIMLFMFGDAISGSVIDNFGRSIRMVRSAAATGASEDRMDESKFEKLNDTWLAGIQEEKVNIRYGAARLPHFFTHTEYWTWQKEYETGAKFDHIKYLRSAIDLDEPPEKKSSAPKKKASVGKKTVGKRAKKSKEKS